MSYRETENSVRQGATRPKIIGCILAFTFLALTSFANPQLDLSNPTGFFTNTAAAMFRQLDLHDLNGNLITVTNIPIYEDPTLYNGTNINYYTPAVHRILQLAANIFDATTNRFIGGGPTNYPTVFRPVFQSTNGIATIIGYLEVTNPVDAFRPMLNASDFIKAAQPLNTNVNLYGVPWVIGAKKGFPNFNEFTMDNALTVFRDLQFTNATPSPPWFSPWTTNQIYNLLITNSFGLEAWNSYTNTYGGSLRLVASNELTIAVTNELGFSLLTVSNLAFGTDTNLIGWPGWSLAKSDSSFKVPLLISTNFTNGIYERNSPFFIPINPPLWNATYQPHLWMSLQFKLRYVLIDTTANRVVDFVNLTSVQPAVDIPAYLDNGANGFEQESDLNAVWDTNFLNHISGILKGIDAQINIGAGLVISSDFKYLPGSATDAQVEKFYDRILNLSDTNFFQCPYSPRRTIHQMVSWQANDPLVHYTVPDVTSTNGMQASYNLVTVAPTRPALTNLGSLNFAYQPWGGYHLPPNGAPLNENFGNPDFDFDVRVKDPGIQQSDDWDFPSGEPLSFEWLSRVHRGTPWQTVFLKYSFESVDDWRKWNNDDITVVTNAGFKFVDAYYTHPFNDSQIASLWARWVNTNDLSTLLSINNPDTNAWAARLDGLTALNNPAPGELDPVIITSNSPPAGFIAQAIQTARANTNPTNGPVFPNQTFQDVGDVLATPQLSVASPFLNTNSLPTLGANGITDEALEKIPTQLLPLLRVDSIGEIEPANGQLIMSFTGYDGHAYVIETSSNLVDWTAISTNSPLDGTLEITNSATSGQQFYRSVLLH